MQKVTLGLLVVVIAALGWIYYDNQQQLQQAQAQTELLEQQLEQQIVQLQQEITGLQQQVETLGNNTTLDGIVRKANNAILDGWESLVTGVEKELQKARQKAEENQQPGPGASSETVPSAADPQ